MSFPRPQVWSLGESNALSFDPGLYSDRRSGARARTSVRAGPFEQRPRRGRNIDGHLGGPERFAAATPRRIRAIGPSAFAVKPSTCGQLEVPCNFERWA